MKHFMDEEFLLDTQTARELYHGVAEKQPIMDYHCHVSPKEIAENRSFANLTQLWLEGDHYKWRLMRACGVPERLITGDAPDQEKFRAWAATLERAVGNPIYHWSHLELKRYFGFDGYLTSRNADAVWEHCQKVIGDGMRVRDILKKSNVTLLCTTDDPADDLCWHEQLAADDTLETVVLPAFRPDKAVNLEKPDFADYIAKLSQSAGTEIQNMDTLLAALDALGMRGDVTRIEFADPEEMSFLYQDRISVLLGTLNELDYKLKLAQHVLLNADGSGCAATDTGTLDFTHISMSSTRKFTFAQGEPKLPSGYVIPEPAAEDTAADDAAPAEEAAASEGDAAAEPPADGAAEQAVPEAETSAEADPAPAAQEPAGTGAAN